MLITDPATRTATGLRRFANLS